jgi:pSer/pThr/pTyr-binding forkhead associated (FHA) protein
MLVGPHGAVLGRSRECDIMVDNPEVSRRHAELAPSENGWTITDLGSTNGVRVNGHTITAPRTLAAGDVIELGNAEVVFELE